MGGDSFNHPDGIAPACMVPMYDARSPCGSRSMMKHRGASEGRSGRRSR